MSLEVPRREIGLWCTSYEGITFTRGHHQESWTLSGLVVVCLVTRGIMLKSAAFEKPADSSARLAPLAAWVCWVEVDV